MKKYLILIMIVIGFCLGYSEKLGTLNELVNPYRMNVSAEKIYIVEGTSIYIYSLKDLKLEKKFGKKGEGPGEFHVPPQTNMGNVSINVLSDSIAVTSWAKLSFFTLNGIFIKEKRASSGWPSLTPIGDKFVGRGTSSKDGLLIYTAKIFDQELKPGKTFCGTQSWYNPGREVNPFFMIGPQYYVHGNKIYMEKDKDEVLVFNNDGRLLLSIDVNQGYQKVKVTTADRNMYLDYFKNKPVFKPIYNTIKKDAKFPKYFPAIRYFFVVNGEIYIMRWTGIDNKLDISIFSPEGKLVKSGLVEVFMSDVIAPYAFAFSNHKLYQLMENEENEGSWDLYATDIK